MSERGYNRDMSSGVARRAGLVALIGVAALAVTTAASGDLRSGGTGPADDLLARVVMPAGALRSETEPAGDGRLLSVQSTSSARAGAARAHGWWIVFGDPGVALDQITAAAQRNLGAQWSSTGWALMWGGPAMVSRILDLPPARGAPSRQLVVAVVGLRNGLTGVRIDANVGQRGNGAVAYGPMIAP